MDKIIHLTTVHPRYDTRIFAKMCSSLAKLGFDTHLIVADGLGCEHKNDVYIHDVSAVRGGRISRMFIGSFRVFRKALSLKGQIYHFHDPELMPIGVLLKLFGKKVIYDIHEDLPRQVLRKFWIPKLFRKPISNTVKAFEKITANIVDGVVTVTPTIAKRFNSVNLVEIRNYALLSEFEMYVTPSNFKNRVTYIGGISVDRGIFEMVNSFEYVEHKFTLGGKFQGQGLEQKVIELNSWKKVEFLGWQSREQVSELLEETLVGLVVLQPTGDYEDAFPVKMFEYMAAGAAVIASDFPLWREIVEGSDCGICVNPESPEDIAESINKLINNKELARKMGQNGRAEVIKKYNWQSEANKLVLFYRKILN